MSHFCFCLVRIKCRCSYEFALTTANIENKNYCMNPQITCIVGFHTQFPPPPPTSSPPSWAPIRLELSGRKFLINSRKTPETLSERFLEVPSRVPIRSTKPYNSTRLRLPEHFQNSLPPVRLGTPPFQKWFRRGPLRAGHGIPSSTEGISDKLTSLSLSHPSFHSILQIV